MMEIKNNILNYTNIMIHDYTIINDSWAKEIMAMKESLYVMKDTQIFYNIF